MEWASLTRLAEKAQLYSNETYFREGLAEAQELLGDGISAAFDHAATIMIKPDGLTSGKARAIVDFLRAHGFTIVGVQLTELSRHQWRELWRYQLSAASLDRLAVNDLILRNRALLLLLRHDGPRDVPASVWLASLKGPADVARQPPGCLRKLLGQPNRLFSAFHVADEPADILRELVILFDLPLRRALLATLAGGGPLAVADQDVLDTTIAESERTARSLDAGSALQRAERAVEGIEGDAAERVRLDLARMRGGEPIAWRPFAAAVRAAALPLDRWDLAILGANFIAHDEAGRSKLIGGVDLDLWR